ncbi:MAG: DNA-processing protein DprA [Nitrospirae bacterium]|nr:DNA-processing protein DprA [Nitrospirota bacterium]
MMALSSNTQAILLLTAPLIAGRGASEGEPLTPGEYKKLARILRDNQREPSDLLGSDASIVIDLCKQAVDGSRLKRLLGRGFLLTQAYERWQARAIWVISRADAGYPGKLKNRLKDDAPPILYGCGDAALLETGGLAVVGSRNVDSAFVEYTEGIGRLAAVAKRTVISGGARGIDQAAMRGALAAGGCVVGVLSEGLERMALVREHREFLMEGRLVLISPYDPSAGFNVGNAMQRNKLIYAFADAALVVSSDVEKGGTWAGAIEQLKKLRFVPVYVRTKGETSKGLDALRRIGALPWPNPQTSEAFAEAISAKIYPEQVAHGQDELSFAVREEQIKLAPVEKPAPESEQMTTNRNSSSTATPAEALFDKVRELLRKLDTPQTDAEVAQMLGVSKIQAKAWLERLVEEGLLEKIKKPLRYRAASSSGRLF